MLNSLLTAGWCFLGVYGSTQVQVPLWAKIVLDAFFLLPIGLICLRDAWRSWRQRRNFVNNGPAIERIS